MRDLKIVEVTTPDRGEIRIALYILYCPASGSGYIYVEETAVDVPKLHLLYQDLAPCPTMLTFRDATRAFVQYGSDSNVLHG